MPQRAPWPATEGDAYRGRAIEFLLPYAGEPDDLRVDELVGLVRADTPLGTLERVVQVIPDRFEYRTGVTYVGSKVEDLLDAGAGVCQDFAHLALVLLRRNGIAARYVSGYLFAPPEGREDADPTPPRSRRTPGWRRWCRRARTAPSRCGSASTRRTAAWPARTT